MLGTGVHTGDTTVTGTVPAPTELSFSRHGKNTRNLLRVFMNCIEQILFLFVSFFFKNELDGRNSIYRSQ